MDRRSKISSGHSKEVMQPLKLTSLENVQSRHGQKNKSLNHMLFKQQIMKDKESVMYQNQHDSSLEDINPRTKGKGEYLETTVNSDNEYQKLLTKFNRNRSKHQRGTDNENSKSFLNTTLKYNSPPHDHHQVSNTSFKSNESRLKFTKKDESKRTPLTLSKCLSMNFLETLELRNRKTPPSREPSEDCLKSKHGVGVKVESELGRVLSELKSKNSLIKQFQKKEDIWTKQLSSKNKVEMEYYKLLNQNILLEEEIRARERRQQERENELGFLHERVACLEAERQESEQKSRRNDLVLTKQYQSSIDEWKKLNSILSDSLVKLNQENSLLAKKLSEVEAKLGSQASKLGESEKLVSMLKSNIEFEKDTNASLLETHNINLEELRQEIMRLEEVTGQLRMESNSKTQQISKYTHRVSQLQSKISKLQNRAQQQFQSQQQQLRQTIILLKLSHRDKQQKYQDTIRQCNQKITTLQDQIQEIKSITCQSYNILQFQPSSQQLDEQKRENLVLQTDIVELKSRLEVFLIIEKELRERLEEARGWVEEVEGEWEKRVKEKETMVGILKERNQLLEKELEVVVGLGRGEGEGKEGEGKMEGYVKEQIVKIRNLEDIVTSLHSANKKLQYQMINKVQFIDELKRQCDKDDQTIKEFKSILKDMNKRLITHSQLLEITNKSAINQLLSFGNYREEKKEEIEALRRENGSLEGELRGIYTKLEILEERIGEEDEESEIGESRKGSYLREMMEKEEMYQRRSRD